jgi:hypothetical protein
MCSNHEAQALIDHQYEYLEAMLLECLIVGVLSNNVPMVFLKRHKRQHHNR